MEPSYTNREIDLMQKGIRRELEAINTNMKTGFGGIHERQDQTNGKVKKIIVALVFAFGLIIGIGAKDFGAVVQFFM